MSDSKKQVPMKDDNDLKTFDELLKEREEAMNGSKFDRELLKKEMDYMAQDVLLVNDMINKQFGKGGNVE